MELFCHFADNKKKELASQSPLWISEELEWWHERSGEPAPRFVQIAALYSELIAVSTTGQLYQWKWNEAEPYKHPEVTILFHSLFLLITQFYRCGLSKTKNCFSRISESKRSSSQDDTIVVVR